MEIFVFFKRKGKTTSTHSHKGCGVGIKVEADCTERRIKKAAGCLISGFNILQSHPEQPERHVLL